MYLTYEYDTSSILNTSILKCMNYCRVTLKAPFNNRPQEKYLKMRCVNIYYIR